MFGNFAKNTASIGNQLQPILHGKMVLHFVKFGSPATLHLHGASKSAGKPNTKLNPHTKNVYIVGYCGTHMYVVWDPETNTVRDTSDVSVNDLNNLCRIQMAVTHRLQGNTEPPSRVERLRQLLSGASGTDQVRMSKPPRRPHKATRLPPDRSGHYQSELDEILNGHRLVDTAEAENERVGGWEMWANVQTTTNNINIDEALSVLHGLEARVQELEDFMKEQSVWNNDITQTLSNMHGGKDTETKKTTRSRRSLNQGNNT
ncbi:hypothetical protein EYZ11_001715 [Aspergillus tanneri]|uniref:Retroviral polymerase SH3-like domain-containing protein n=1 Tax=Aspergillus tanneri TaxID=1220188 RepID=A0A4S3JTU5_9EURO|nr:hypothetical protein EYZ11_001715 [Aspergillus tanneri]